MADHDRQVFYETFSSIAWFLMDACWMLELSLPAHLLAVPTILTGLAVFRYAERTAANLAIVAAMNAWACMNVCWMMSDLGTFAQGLVPARIFLSIGIVALLSALFIARSSREAVLAVLARFRRLRLGR